VLAGAPAVLLSRFQSVLNAAARLVSSANRSAHTTPLLQKRHWIRVPVRIQFRLCVQTYHSTWANASVQHPAVLQDDSSALLTHPLCWFHRHVVQRSAIMLFRWLQLGLGTLYHRRESKLLHQSSRSGGNLKPSCFQSHIFSCVMLLWTLWNSLLTLHGNIVRWSYSSNVTGGAANLGSSRKEQTYASIGSQYLFAPIGVETLGPLKTSACQLFANLRKSTQHQAMRGKELFCSRGFQCCCSATTLSCHMTPCQPLTARIDDLICTQFCIILILKLLRQHIYRW